jgi:hypothetical protein
MQVTGDMAMRASEISIRRERRRNKVMVRCGREIGVEKEA